MNFKIITKSITDYHLWLVIFADL